MPNVKFDATVSTGNIISILAMLVTVTAGYVTMAKTLEALTLRLTQIESEASAFEGRLRATELTQAGQASDLRSIQATLQKIDGKLDRLSQQKY